MEQARLVIAIVLSVLVFLAWQFFFVDKEAIQKSTATRIDAGLVELTGNAANRAIFHQITTHLSLLG